MLKSIIIVLAISFYVFLLLDNNYWFFYALLPFIAIFSLIMHELGHLVLAKLTGHIVEEFSIFRGRKIYSKILFNIEFCLRHPFLDDNKKMVIGSGHIKTKDNFEISNLGLVSGGVLFNFFIIIISLHYLNLLNMNYLSDCMTYLFKTTSISNVLSNIDSNLNSISSSVISKSILMELALINSIIFFSNLVPIKIADGYFIAGLDKENNGIINKIIGLFFIVLFIAFLKIILS